MPSFFHWLGTGLKIILRIIWWTLNLVTENVSNGQFYSNIFFFYTSAVMVKLGEGEVRCVILTKKLIICVAMSRDGMILKAKVG